MAAGDNPNSRKNLISLADRPPEERKAIASMGGSAMGKKKRLYNSLKEAFEGECTPEAKAEIGAKVVGMAKRGNLRATELLIEMLGEKPKEQAVIEVKQSPKLDAILSQIGGEGLDE